MTNANTVIEIIAQITEVDIDKISLSSRFLEDILADSMTRIDLTRELEDEFSIVFRDNETVKVATVQDAIDLVDKEVLQTHGRVVY